MIMTPQSLQELLSKQLPDCIVYAEGDGSHFMVRLIGDRFNGLSTLKRQQQIYACVNEQIASGEIHALTIKALTPVEQQQIKET